MFGLIFFIGLLSAQTDSIAYSFFIAGHTYGKPGVNNIGLHPPFKGKFGYIQNREEIKFGVLLGDIVSPDPIAQDWDEVDTDIDSLGLQVYFAVGNHDMENRPLFESRYGDTYYYFLFQNDLFIVLDPNIDGWNISGTQLEFLENVVQSNYESVDYIFVLFHQLLWWESDNIYASIKPNSFAGMDGPINFWTEIEPLFYQLPNEVVFCSGDFGAAHWSDDFMYDTYDNISFIGSGMGEGIGDNFIVINIDSNKAINYDLICLNDTVLSCFGELTDYQLSPSDTYEMQVNSPKIYPNPTRGSFAIAFEEKTKVTIQIMNMNGQLILEKKSDEKIEHEIELPQLPKGMYIVKMTNEHSHLISRLVVQ